MPVYNAAKYLDASIKSIFNQTFSNFEFIIINDCSIDNSKKIIKSYDDKRIRYYENYKNLGIAATLNHGLELSKGKYIVRMDADDISLPKRIEKQIDFMETNSKTGICGTYCKTFGLFEKEFFYPTLHSEILKAILTYNPIAHPTAIFRNDFFKKFKLNYSVKYKYCEDYELWTRAIKYFEIANIPEILLYHRRHTQQASFKHKEEQKLNAFKIKERLKLLNEKQVELFY